MEANKMELFRIVEEEIKPKDKPIHTREELTRRICKLRGVEISDWRSLTEIVFPISEFCQNNGNDYPVTFMNAIDDLYCPWNHTLYRNESKDMSALEYLLKELETVNAVLANKDWCAMSIDEYNSLEDCLYLSQIAAWKKYPREQIANVVTIGELLGKAKNKLHKEVRKVEAMLSLSYKERIDKYCFTAKDLIEVKAIFLYLHESEGLTDIEKVVKRTMEFTTLSENIDRKERVILRILGDLFSGIGHTVGSEYGEIHWYEYLPLLDY